MRKTTNIKAIRALTLLSFLSLMQQPAYSGFGNLFSGANNGTDSLPNGATSPNTPPGAIGTVDGDDGTARHSDKPSKSGSNASPPPGDYTEDEKRMQGRYTGDLGHAKALIDKAERMLKSGNPKVQKKGAILKQIAEKELARLKENNPFPAQHSLDDKPRGGNRPDSL